jgi:hypothetical protein
MCLIQFVIFGLPLCASVGLFSLGEWKWALAALVFEVVLLGTQYENFASRNMKENQEIEAKLDNIRAHKVGALWALHRGDNLQAKRTLEYFNKREKELRDKTEVVNLDPLGHNVGKRWKR